MIGVKKLIPYIVLFGLIACGIAYRYSRAAFNDPVLDAAFGRSARQSPPVKFEGKVAADPEDRKTFVRYPVELTKIDGNQLPENNPSTILLKDATQNIRDPIRFGDNIAFNGILKRPSSIESEDGRVFDYAHYLSKDDIFHIAESRDVRKKSESKNQGSLIDHVTYYLYEMKRAFIANVERLLPAPHSFLGEGLVISGKGSLDKDLQTQFQRVGLIHIVVLSGFNISIVGEAIIKIFSFLPKIIGGVVGASGIILFGMMTGGGATVWRSVIMAIIGIYARLSGRQNRAVISLFVAGSIMLLITPKLLFHDPSFQLSFMATFGLILFAAPFEARLRKICRLNSLARSSPDSLKVTDIARTSIQTKVLDSFVALLSSLVSLVSSTMATQIFTLPMIINFSGVVSIIALPVNIVVLPLIPLTMLFVFVGGVVSFISASIAVLPTFVSWLLLSYELWIVRVSSALPLAALKLPPISGGVFTSMYVALFAFAFVLHYGAIHDFFFPSGARQAEGLKRNTTPV